MEHRRLNGPSTPQLADLMIVISIISIIVVVVGGGRLPLVRPKSRVAAASSPPPSSFATKTAATPRADVGLVLCLTESLLDLLVVVSPSDVRSKSRETCGLYCAIASTFDGYSAKQASDRGYSSLGQGRLRVGYTALQSRLLAMASELDQGRPGHFSLRPTF